MPLAHHCAALHGRQMLWTLLGVGRPDVASSFWNFPHRLGSYCYDDAPSTATPAPRSDGLPLAGGNALGYQRTESAHVTAGLTAGIGLARARDDGCDTTATRPAWSASGA